MVGAIVDRVADLVTRNVEWRKDGRPSRPGSSFTGSRLCCTIC
jgi:hypothetical protein